MRRCFRQAALALLIPLLAACPLGDVLGLDFVNEPAVLILSRDTSEVLVPDTVIRGVPFEVRLRTFGGGCVREIARTNSAWLGNELVIRPYNRRSTGDDVCTADIKYLTHAVSATRSGPGEIVLKVIGHEMRTSSYQVPVELSRTIVVR